MSRPDTGRVAGARAKAPWWAKILVAVGVAFGAFSINASGGVLVAPGDAAAGSRAWAWFGLVNGLAYVVSGVGLWGLSPWAVRGAVLIAAATLGAFAAYGLWVLFGNPLDVLAVAELGVRFTVWTAIAASAQAWLGRNIEPPARTDRG